MRVIYKRVFEKVDEKVAGIIGGLFGIKPLSVREYKVRLVKLTIV